MDKISDIVKEMCVNVLLRTALIVDVTNLYFEINQKHPNKRLRILDYAKLLESQGHLLTFKIAYSRQAPGTAQNFAHLLSCHGFETHFGQNSWSIAIALRAAQILPNVDAFVLGSVEPEMVRLLKYARDLGKITKCFAINIPIAFAEVSECAEIPESVLDDTTKKAKSVELPSSLSSNGA